MTSASFWWWWWWWWWWWQWGVWWVVGGGGPLGTMTSALFYLFCSLASATATTTAPYHVVYALLLDVFRANWCTFDGVVSKMGPQAFGAPSLVDGAGGIGAAELVRPGHDEAVAADLRDPAAVAGLLVGILAGDHAKVAAISANARARAVAHDQLAYGRAIHRSLTECSR